MGRPPTRMTAKVKALLAAYGGQAGLNLTEAARLAGYSKPAQQGHNIRRKWPEAFDKVEAEFQARLQVSDEELDQVISNLVRSPKHKDHYKAVELMCRMKGRLSEKVHVTLDRSNLNGQLDSMLTMLLQSRASATNITIETAEVALLPTITTIDESATN